MTPAESRSAGGKPGVLIICRSRLDRDPRVRRQLEALVGGHDITTCGFSPPGGNLARRHLPLVESNERPGRNRFARLLDQSFRHYSFLHWPRAKYRRLAAGLPRELNFDLVIANEVETMPLALRFALEHGAKILLDAHEYTPEMGPSSARNRLLRQNLWEALCLFYLPKADAMTTVGPEIAGKYRRRFGVNPEVVTNAVKHEDLAPSPVNPARVEIVHHGTAGARRRTETLLDLIDLLDERFFLTLMLMPSRSAYYRKLAARAAAHPRVALCEPVPTGAIARAINRFDIGIHLLPPTCYNHLMALPNKLFEFIQGRLAVAAWPSPEMAALAGRYGCGIISDDFTLEGMARKINRLSSAEIMRMKENAHRAARELHAEGNAEKIRAIVGELVRR